MTEQGLDQLIEGQASGLMSTRALRRDFGRGVVSLLGLGLAACSASSEPKKPTKFLPKLNPSEKDDPTLTNEQRNVARRFRQDTLDSVQELLSQAYLDRGIMLARDSESFWVEYWKDMKHGGTNTLEFIFTALPESGISQAFTISNYYRLDDLTITKREVTTGNTAPYLFLGSVPNQEAVRHLELDGPTSQVLEAITQSVFDVPDGLGWQDGSEARMASGEIDKRFYDLQISVAPNRSLTATFSITELS